MSKAKKIKIKRAYDEPAAKNGYRILVDRIWPRGVSKQDLQTDEWVKDAAPSTRLRKWFAHDPDKWNEFKKRYFEELESKKEMLQPIYTSIKKEPVTLVYASKEQKFNNAAVLKEYLESTT
jgi:uncharacterized protein YeaO (DUF488 family)